LFSLIMHYRSKILYYLSPPSVCQSVFQSVRLITQKVMNEFLMKFIAWVGRFPETKWTRFQWRHDAGIFFWGKWYSKLFWTPFYTLGSLSWGLCCGSTSKSLFSRYYWMTNLLALTNIGRIRLRKIISPSANMFTQNIREVNYEMTKQNL